MKRNISTWLHLLYSYLIEPGEYYDWPNLVKEQWPHIVISGDLTGVDRVANFYIKQLDDIFGGPGDFIAAFSHDYIKAYEFVIGFSSVHHAIMARLQLQIHDGHYIEQCGYDEDD